MFMVFFKKNKMKKLLTLFFLIFAFSVNAQSIIDATESAEIDSILLYNSNRTRGFTKYSSFLNKLINDLPEDTPQDLQSVLNEGGTAASIDGNTIVSFELEQPSDPFTPWFQVSRASSTFSNNIGIAADASVLGSTKTEGLNVYQGIIQTKSGEVGIFTTSDIGGTYSLNSLKMEVPLDGENTETLVPVTTEDSIYLVTSVNGEIADKYGAVSINLPSNTLNDKTITDGYTPIDGDEEKLLIYAGSSDITVNAPLDSNTNISIGSIITIEAQNVGMINFGDFATSTDNRVLNVKKTGVDDWRVIGKYYDTYNQTTEPTIEGYQTKQSDAFVANAEMKLNRFKVNSAWFYEWSQLTDPQYYKGLDAVNLYKEVNSIGSYSGASTSFVVTESLTADATSKYALIMTSTRGETGIVSGYSGNIDVEIGQTYRIEVWCSEVDHPAWVIALPDWEGWQSGVTPVDINASPIWDKYTIEGTATATTVRILFQGGSTTQDGDQLVIDNLTVTKL